MAGTTINITDAGRAALVNADHTGTTARKIVQAGIATAPFAFDAGLQALPNEHKRLATISGETIAADTVHATIRDDSADQYTTYGFGLYLDNGVLLGTYCQDTPIMEKARVAILLLAVDMVFKQLDVTALSFGDAAFTNPPATTERQGVVELATNEETSAGEDGSRAVTPAGLARALAPKAPLDSPHFSGAAYISGVPTEKNAQLTLMGASGALGMESKLRFFATFGGGTADTGTRPVASLRAGFDRGVWGTEYLDFYLNNANNDSHSDANQHRVLRLTATAAAVKGNLSVAGVTSFGSRAAAAWINTDDTTAYLYGSKNVSVGAAEGQLGLIAGNALRVSIMPSGRVLVGSGADDGTNQLQVDGTASASGGLQSKGMDTGGANFRAVSGSTYGVMLRNDGDSAYLLQTAKNDPYGQWNSYRPFAWGLRDGYVRIDASGSGTEFGGPVIVNHSKPLAVRGSAGTQRELQFQTDGTTRWKIIADSSDEAGDNAGTDLYIQSLTDGGKWLSNPLKIARKSGRVTIANGMDVGGSLNVDGKPVWHAGNLPNPLTTDGGWLAENGRLNFGVGYGRCPLQVSPNGTDSIGGAFTEWNNTRSPALQIDCPSNVSAYMGIRWTQWGKRHLAAIDCYAGGSDASLPYISMHVGTCVNAFKFSGNGDFEAQGAIYAGGGGGVLTGNGNVYMSWAGMWLSDYLSSLNNGKAATGASCQWNSGIVEFGAVPTGERAGIADLPAPYVLVGLRNAFYLLYLRAVHLRNQ